MPRVRIPNASLIASADLPILPFLAPRVFAASPHQRESRQNGRHDGIQKEKEKKGTRAGKLSQAQEERGIQDTCQRRGTVSRQPKDFAAGLLQTSRKQSPRLASVNRLYADISAFARQHARSYATAFTDRSVPGRVRPLPRRIRRVPSARASALVQNAPRRASRREKALALERDRLRNYISRLPPGLAKTERMRHGQYRSLARRVSNLTGWSATRLNLSKTTGRTKNRHRLNLAFAALDRALYASLGQHTRKIVITHHPRCASMSGELYPPDTSIDTHGVWTRWMELDTRSRKAYAYRLLVYLLDRKPDRALRFIQVLANDPILRRHETEAIADALGHLSKVHAAGLYAVERKWGADPSAHKRLFVPAFVHVFEKALAKQPNVCSQDLLYNLVQLAEMDDLKKVFDCLVKHRTYLGFDTILHYASTFGEAGQVEYALRCLDELRARHSKAWGSVVERTRLRWTCTTILRKSMSQSEDFHATPLVVAALVRLGIKMDVLLYNTVMHNAMEAGDYATAFKVYNALESNGLKADKHTFSILLHGCTLQSNPGMFQSFAQYCAEVAKETKDAWLATDYLYYLYVRHQTDTEPEHASALLWQAYTSFFSATSLRLLVDINITPTPDSTHLPPPPVALYIMLQIEIRTASSISNQRVLNLYQSFLSLASSSSIGPFRALIQNPTIWNAFLLAFCHAQQFSSAANLIRDMSSSPVFPNPNIYTWNIFMQSFFKTGQVAAAERVFEIMRSRNVEPDQFTYGVLLRGYAKGQMVERVGETMQRIKSEEELDPGLMRALATVVDRRRLMLTLEQSRILKETQAHEDAEKRVEEERVRWQPPRFGLRDVGETMVRQGEEVGEDIPTPETGEGGDEVVEDEALFGFLSDDERVEPATPPSPLASSSTHPQPIPQPQPRIRTLPRNDPEVQYRLLQQQLGIITPSSSPVPEVKKVATFGAGLGFKSMLSKKDKGSEISSEGFGSNPVPGTNAAGGKKKSGT